MQGFGFLGFVFFFLSHFNICKCSCHFLETILFLQVTINQSPIFRVNSHLLTENREKKTELKIRVYPTSENCMLKHASSQEH